MRHRKLNIAEICPSTKVLGPGNRFVIWVQGCCFDCYNCVSPEWTYMEDKMLISTEDLSQEILKARGIEGITISGGEPMLQAEALHELVRTVRYQKQLSVICYTGFTLEQLKEAGDPKIDAFLSQVDVIIDGPYVDRLNDNKGWRGSSNQQAHFLSGIYKDFAEEFINRKRDIEIHLFHNYYLMVGIKPKEIAKELII